MAKSNPYLDFLVEEFAPLGRIDSKSMFGGHCLYCNGVVFALVAGQSVYLKTDALNRPAFEAKGLGPFRPFADHSVIISYYAAPAETFESLEGLREWAGGAIAASERNRKAPRKRKKPVS